MKKGVSSNQLEFHFESLILPEVNINKSFGGIGNILHLVRREQRITPLSKEKIAVSKRRKETLYHFPFKQSVIITDKKTHPKFSKASSILCNKNGKTKWLFDMELEGAQALLNSKNPSDLRDNIQKTWANSFTFKKENRSPEGMVLNKGLRIPQIGALHSIAAYWTLNSDPATVVMPTGSGKTETMLSVQILERCKCLLVIVPSKSLREQTAKKFYNLGVLRETGNIDEKAKYPVVGVLKKRPKTNDDLEIFDRCNVVVSVINTIAQGTAKLLIPQIVEKCSHLIVDEAHHVPARSWSDLRDAFKGKPTLQFTATPYREDKTSLMGKIIYNYPLSRAQKDGLFQKINFQGVFKTDSGKADIAIVEKAITQIKKDISKGYSHVLMARCQSKKRADNVFKLYQKRAPDLKPVLIYSDQKDIEEKIQNIRIGKNKIIVCVNMLTEGFDLPELKIAAMHDKFKSLAITLQFTGRFARTANKKIGDATIIANTGIEDVSESLQSLYDEDPDWDKLISKLSFDKIEEEHQLLQFLQKAEKLPVQGKDDFASVTPLSLIPKFSTVVYRCKEFHPHNFHKGIEKGHSLEGAWINENPDVIFFVTHSSENPQWCRNRSINDSFWNIFVAYFDGSKGLLYIHSSFDSKSLHSNLANELSEHTAIRIDGENVFKVFGNIKRLLLGQVGLLQVGPRNLRYSMFVGRDVERAISDVISGQSQKSNIFGTGFEKGEQVGLGCSKKGKIWSRDKGPINLWTKWCDQVGAKLIDDSINVANLISNVLVPKEIYEIPKAQVLFIDWHDTFYKSIEERVIISDKLKDYSFYNTEIAYLNESKTINTLNFCIRYENNEATYAIKLSKDYKYGYVVIQESGSTLYLRIGSIERELSEFFSDYPPCIFFNDLSELSGNFHIKVPEKKFEFPMEQIVTPDWQNVNIRKESFWKDGELRSNSIQEHVMKKCREDGFEIVFDDDGSNEIADVVCIREDIDQITIRMIHCKYSLDDKPGGRIKDVVEVASQATKNIRWFWSFKKLLQRLLNRENSRKRNRPSRFFLGNHKTIKYFKRLYKVKGLINKEVIIAQPGVSVESITGDMISVLGASDAYSKTTIETPLFLWCSK